EVRHDGLPPPGRTATAGRTVRGHGWSLSGRSEQIRLRAWVRDEARRPPIRKSTPFRRRPVVDGRQVLRDGPAGASSFGQDDRALRTVFADTTRYTIFHQWMVLRSTSMTGRVSSPPEPVSKRLLFPLAGEGAGAR